MGEIINEGLQSDNEETYLLAVEMTFLVEDIQVKELPILRKEYVLLAADILEFEDIGLYSDTLDYKTLYFVGDGLPKGRTVKKYQNDLTDIFLDFRFIEVNYYWEVEDDSNYLCFEIDSPLDCELYSN